MKLTEITDALTAYHPQADLDIVRRAHQYISEKHQSQKRASGEPYIIHLEETALLTTRLRLDELSVAAALLHDVVEDTGTPLADVEELFGPEVAALVDGVTKLSKVEYQSREIHQAENFRKMLLAMARDIRILLIKLCDRTHNLRTLKYLSDHKQKRIARETLEIFAPLAHRLGIHWMKSELEDQSFRYLEPEMYEKVKSHINKRKEEREAYIRHVVALIDDELSNHSLNADVSGRSKHFYSIYCKMQRDALSIDDIYDLIAFRIIVDSKISCYTVVGIIHSAWKPIPGRFKDYIAMPKPNGYQSLHTTVMGPWKERIEVQIRSEGMHEIAEKGIAAHWAYKEGRKSKQAEIGKEFNWLRDLLESERLNKNPRDFLNSVKDDLFSSEVFVFSPNGDVFELAAGSCPLDFAFAVHSEVGNHCKGARVNGRQVPISHRLKNGDTVEIITDKRQLPKKDWLNYVVTTKAKQRIRSWLRLQERSASIDIGRELVEKDLAKMGKSIKHFEKDGALQSIAEDNGYSEISLMFADIGYGRLNSRTVVGRLIGDERQVEHFLNQKRPSTTVKKTDSRGIKVSGMGRVMFSFPKCCEPLPGDEIVGYVTVGRGVTVHRATCKQILMFDPRRLIDVSWDNEIESERQIQITVYCQDGVGMLAKMANCISTGGASIRAANASTTPEGKARNTFEISIRNSSQLEEVKRSLLRIDGVYRVESAGR